MRSLRRPGAGVSGDEDFGIILSQLGASLGAGVVRLQPAGVLPDFPDSYMVFDPVQVPSSDIFTYFFNFEIEKLEVGVPDFELLTSKGETNLNTSSVLGPVDSSGLFIAAGTVEGSVQIFARDIVTTAAVPPYDPFQDIFGPVVVGPNSAKSLRSFPRPILDPGQILPMGQLWPIGEQTGIENRWISASNRGVVLEVGRTTGLFAETTSARILVPEGSPQPDAQTVVVGDLLGDGNRHVVVGDPSFGSTGRLLLFTIQ